MRIVPPGGSHQTWAGRPQPAAPTEAPVSISISFPMEEERPKSEVPPGSSGPKPDAGAAGPTRARNWIIFIVGMAFVVIFAAFFSLRGTGLVRLVSALTYGEPLDGPRGDVSGLDEFMTREVLRGLICD
ncbi:hypothetical protein NLJ89_g8724 [Agrocybe chaxingu]|uniref:Uncharacterized protein n=1 Tax=Agrocybe chaxingu TaxID=84603 RepID=A0A9W8MSI0_9AGAR|nr:hypothetical protein NLJ89_g8724 [Agrocybe chaxingu]